MNGWPHSSHSSLELASFFFWRFCFSNIEEKCWFAFFIHCKLFNKRVMLHVAFQVDCQGFL